MTPKEWAQHLAERLEDDTSLALTDGDMAVVEEVIRAAVIEEREACAKVGDDAAARWLPQPWDGDGEAFVNQGIKANAARAVACLIRSRGHK